MKRAIILFLALLILVSSGYFIFSPKVNGMFGLSPEELHKKIIQERDHGISLAVAAGDYRCCIEPVCTMCYMEANQWNNFTAGTCACDDLIAQGKEACPQCKRTPATAQSENTPYCDISLPTPSTCDLKK